MMTDCSRKDNYASSEVFQYQTDPYCWVNTLPLEFDPVDQSSLSLSFQDCSLSPAAISELSSDSGYAEMVYPWSPSSSSADYVKGQAMDHNTFSQSPADDVWHVNGPVAAQDTAAWLNATEAPVNIGLSRAPSYESQSTHTLSSFSEPDAYTLPASVDFPLTTEASAYGPYVYTSPDASTDYGFPYSCDPSGASMACTSYNPVELFPGSSPVFFPHGGQAAYTRHVVVPQGHPMRTLLPRTEPTAAPSQPAFGPQRILRPSAPGSRQFQSSTGNVSSSYGLPHGTPVSTLSGQSGLHATSGASLCLPAVMDPTAEDFSAFISLDHDDQSALEGKRSVKRAGYVPGSKAMMRNPAYVAVETKPSLSDLELDMSKPLETDPDKTMAVVIINESDEGRHRTHPDYSKPPHPDGLYRCPYKDKTKESCSHKPTKLKCNYDKYIDSHVKPFRCKLEACSKQEFSSTACLLRHEREAHGMHGHGDRPHLCYYPGCDRGQPGYGFPRRYNLFDHMKRVHDHKEDAVDSTGSPILGGETQKKIKGAKRKPSSPLISEPAVQRQKTMASPHEQSQAAQMSPVAYYQGHVAFPYYHAPQAGRWSRTDHNGSYYGMSAH